MTPLASLALIGALAIGAYCLAIIIEAINK